MDSLTQIVLGASMGEAVAGRKIGNKAMLWGAVAGTIPDLDVFGGLLGMSEAQALAFHRGISHSILFSFVAPLLLAWYTHWLYKNKHNQNIWLKAITATSGILFLLFCGAIINFIPYAIIEGIYYPTLIGAIILIVYFSYRLIAKYFRKEQEVVHMSYARWYLLFFVAIFSHPILDCCTGYGTQLFQPFSDVRLAWNNISVADPLYTFPFLLLVILAATRQKENRWRTILNYIGIGWSLLYLAWTVRNKIIVDQVFTNSLSEQNITFSRHMTTPSILNNVLWHCIAEGDDVYYDGYYSLLDSAPKVDIQEIEKNHNLISNEDDNDIKTLKWFANDYYNLMQLEGDTIQFNDLRYGASIGGSYEEPSDYIFPFRVVEQGRNYKLLPQNAGPPRDSMSEFWNALINRIKGQ